MAQADSAADDGRGVGAGPSPVSGGHLAPLQVHTSTAGCPNLDPVSTYVHLRMLYRLRRPHLSRHTVSRPPDPARASLGSTTTRLPLEPTARSRSLVDKIEQARAAAIRSLARDLRIDPSEAERWCVAWELFARRQGAARSVYFWDAGRGWIDAQRAMGRVVLSAAPPPARVVRSSQTSVATARRADRAS